MKFRDITGPKGNYNRYYKRFSQLSGSPQVKVSGLVSLTLFTIAFFGVFAIMPTFKTMASLNKEIEDAEIVDTKLSKKIVSLEQAEDVFKDIENQTSLLDQVLPQNHSFERLAWQIAWLAKDKGVIIANESFDEFLILESQVISDGKKATLPVELSISGSYEEIKGFLVSLSKVDRLISVDEVAITSKKLRSEEGALSANIKLTAYYFPVEQL